MHIYTHIHHIVPRHAGGTDSHDNLIELTIEDHAIAHEVRYRIYGDDRDRVAAQMIRGQISGYDAFIEMVSRPKSEAWKKKRSEAMSGEGNPMWGKTTSQKQKKAVRIANSVPKPYVAEAQSKLYAEGKSNLCNRIGALNGMSRAVLVGDQRYDTVAEAAEAHGVSRNTARRRLTVDTFPNWRYEE